MNQEPLDLGQELVVDLFAGGGGASTGIEAALGRPIDVAVNHDEAAIAMHKANHPETLHLCEDVFSVNPRKVAGHRQVGLLWASPDCTHHSKARGGKPRSKKIRGLAWVVVKWAKRLRPRVIMLENVEEFADWGPLLADGSLCPKRKGFTFRRWVADLERLGYAVEWRELRACDYGAPTIRKRLFVVARRDGRPIAWPEPTHGPGLQPVRTAAECIDWSIPCPSIFLSREEARAAGVRRPLAENTMNRIREGMRRFVIEHPDPFIINLTHSGRLEEIDEPIKTVTAAHRGEKAVVVPKLTPFITEHANGSNQRNMSADEPLRTICAQVKGGHFAVVAPYFVPRYGERKGQAPRCQPADAPLSTIVPTQNGAQLVAAFLEQANTGMVGHEAEKPLSTIVGKGCTQRVVAAHLINFKGSHRSMRDARDSAFTITANGTHVGAVAAFLAPYYGSGSGLTGRDLRDPAPTVTSKDRLQLITVTIGGHPYVIADIGMRMLTPRELYRCQGFPADYIIDRGPGDKPLTKTAQVRMVGNSVSPPPAEALVRANFAHEAKVGAAA